MILLGGINENLSLLAAALGPVSSHASVLTYVTEDCFGIGCYGSSELAAGATLKGLAPSAVTLATTAFRHGFPFSLSAGDFPGPRTTASNIHPPFVYR